MGHVDAITTPMTTPTEDSAGGGGHGLEGPLIGVGVVLLVISLLLIAVGIFLCARCIRYICHVYSPRVPLEAADFPLRVLSHVSMSCVVALQWHL